MSQSQNNNQWQNTLLKNKAIGTLPPILTALQSSNFQQIVAVKSPLTKTTSRSLLQEISCRRNYHIKGLLGVISRIRNISRYSVNQNNNNFCIYTKEEQETINKAAIILESFRTITKQAFYRVTGTINEDNIYAAQTSLLWQNLMMFKSWMPGVVGERVGKITYDEITDTLDMPRYTALTKWIAPKGQRNLKKIISRAGLLSIDIMTYGIAKKALYKDGKRVNNELSEAQFKAWKYKNPVAAENVTKEEFERMQEGQMRAAVFELRAILSFFAVVLLLGSDDEDDFYSHKNNYAMRQANKILNKSLSELTYFWTPTSISDLLSRPIGLLSLGQNITGVVTNGFDEGYDIITGQNSKGQDMTDRTPPGYYSTKLIVGLNGLRSTVDWIFSEDKKVR